MEAQLKNLAAGGVLGNFIGMLTDSRSFLSYTRHEYFRRILCALLGRWVEEGQFRTTGRRWSAWWPTSPTATALPTSASAAITYGGQKRYEYDQRQGTPKKFRQA